MSVSLGRCVMCARQILADEPHPSLLRAEGLAAGTPQPLCGSCYRLAKRRKIRAEIAGTRVANVGYRPTRPAVVAPVTRVVTSRPCSHGRSTPLNCSICSGPD